MAIQIGRQAFLTFSAEPHDRLGGAFTSRSGSAFAAPFWIVGALVDGDARIAFWLVALTIGYCRTVRDLLRPLAEESEPRRVEDR